MVVRWIFLDLTDSTTATFEINPNDGGSPTYEKNVTSTSTLAPGGKTLLSEGSEKQKEISFSGIVLNSTMYDFMVTWFTKKHQIRLTDDLGRVMMIYITKFEPKRIRRASHPYYHTYTVTAQILDWP